MHTKFPFLLGIHCLRYFKISPHRLFIETCRYYDAPTHKNKTICKDCIGTLVVVEIHFLVQRDKYSQQKEKSFKRVHSKLNTFTDLSDKKQQIFGF